MRYLVVIPRQVQKDLDRIERKYHARIKTVLESLSEDPYIGKKLDGKFADVRSCRVWPYRILYRIKEKELVVLIIRIWHRQRAYR